ncbi:MAG: tRNA preQ1(34) S-adenosylmethionine ribosyltransferase-isomerase QueA [bacterium]
MKEVQIESSPMLLSDFSYDLPQERIAQHPLPKRDESRLMVLHRRTKTIEHRTFSSICEYLRPKDLLVLNDTRVIPCRLFGRKRTGGKLEVFFLRAIEENHWEVLIRGKVKLHESFLIAEGTMQMVGQVTGKKDRGRCTVMFSSTVNNKGDNTGDKVDKKGKEAKGLPVSVEQVSVEQVLEAYGQVPLPPYISHFQSPTIEDQDRYQTVFARQKGAVAAPTAGLHFTDSVLNRLRSQGVKIAFVTLHVGLGTFQPVRAEVIQEHRMEAEYYEIPEETLCLIAETKSTGGHVIACGTTSTRVLESLGQNPDPARQGARQGWTDLFIYPGFSFCMVDGLITNFHLPQSTLLMLVSAFGGRGFVLEAYQQAVACKYRFYSYGDAMLIV